MRMSSAVSALSSAVAPVAQVEMECAMNSSARKTAITNESSASPAGGASDSRNAIDACSRVRPIGSHMTLESPAAWHASSAALVKWTGEQRAMGYGERARGLSTDRAHGAQPPADLAEAVRVDRRRVSVSC